MSRATEHMTTELFYSQIYDMPVGCPDCGENKLEAYATVEKKLFIIKIFCVNCGKKIGTYKQ